VLATSPSPRSSTSDDANEHSLHWVAGSISVNCIMQIHIRVRPTQGYHYPHRIDDLQLDSSARLETIQESYSTQGSTTRLYYGPHELPLNSSIGSHNFEDGAIIECCRSPTLSAALSACLKDLDRVKKLHLHERTRNNLVKILQTPIHIQNDTDHDIWQPSSWSNDSIKSRTINFATMKAVIQRQDRYLVHDLPQCNNCQSLYDGLQTHKVWSGGNGGRKSKWNSQAHIFKPLKKDGTGPTTNWILLDAKLTIMNQIKRELSSGFSSEDYVEEFVRRDHSRHGSSNTPNRRNATTRSPSRARDDSESYLAHLAASPPRSEPSPQQSPARNRMRPSPAMNNDTPNSTSTKYIPQYASGPFSILATLHLALHAKHKRLKGRRMLTLTEDELKRLAQPICRSNLYDKTRIRGRNAFKCMDTLIEKKLVRKEIVRNPSTNSEIEKWGLLTDGELMGGFCEQFERAVSKVVPRGDVKARASGKSINVVLCMDTREDAHYLERMKWQCEDEDIPFIEKELPAGDYIFLEESLEEIVPLVIERKSWSDLADSCSGKGRANNRLDCVRLDSSDGMGCAGNCQLCKMKRCGCTQILFVIEGERCQGVQRNVSCSVNNPCNACKLLSERHGVTQTDLEEVLSRLQIDHGCHIHYTKSFNDTAQSLFVIRTLLQSNACFASRMLEKASRGSSLSYNLYRSNAQRRIESTCERKDGQLDSLNEWDIQSLITAIGDSPWDESTVSLLLGSEQTDRLQKKAKTTSDKPPNETIVLDSDDDSVKMVANHAQQKQPETIRLDFDSDDSIVILDDEPEMKLPRKRKLSHSSTKPSRGKNGSTLLQCSSESENPLLVLHGLAEYEARFGKVLEKIWREVYQTADGDLNVFYDKSVRVLNNTTKSSPFPFLHWSTISAFSLWLQLIVGIQVRFVVRGTDVVSEIRHKQNSSTSSVKKYSTPNSGPAPQTQQFSSDLYSSPRQTEKAASKPPARQLPPFSATNALREARLQRFDNSYRSSSAKSKEWQFPQSITQPLSSTTWSCQHCTLENDLVSKKCEACGYPSGRLNINKPSDTTQYSIPERNNYQSFVADSHLSNKWTCQQCTLQNDYDSMQCSVCGHPGNPSALNPQSFQSNSETWFCRTCSSENRKSENRCNGCGDENPSPTDTPAKKRVKCGACGCEGHNRSTATEENCDAYYNDKEIERREKLRQKKEDAIRQEKERVKQMEKEGETAGTLHEEWLAKTEELKRNHAQAEEYRNNELKRAREKIKRLEKRQR
jgi:ERCC4-type nuclease